MQLAPDCCTGILIRLDNTTDILAMKINVRAVRASAEEIRAALERAFRADTGFPRSVRTVPSAGHCAAVAVLVRRRLGGWLVSAVVEDQSHWFNRLRAGNRLLDVDLTGDQFGRAPIQIRGFGRLYDGTRVRRPAELLPETLARSQMLERRAQLGHAGGARKQRRVASKSRPQKKR